MLSIPEKATQVVEQILLQNDGDSLRTIFLIGSKDVGKSTLINVFVDKAESTRETLVLEYSFARKTNSKQRIEKIICHIWEYGGKLDILKNILSSIPLQGQIYCCILLDLSKLKLLWETIDHCFNVLNEMRSKSDITPIIIGGKYDIFKNYDTEVKKIVCTTVRSVAILQNAYLMFYSSKDPILLKRAKEMLNNIGFGNGTPFKEKNTNHMKPLLIPKCSDNWESIGVHTSTFDEVRIRYLSKITPDTMNTIASIAITQKFAHPEPVFDSLANIKYDELRNKESLDMSIDDYLRNINKQ